MKLQAPPGRKALAVELARLSKLHLSRKLSVSDATAILELIELHIVDKLQNTGKAVIPGIGTLTIKELLNKKVYSPITKEVRVIDCKKIKFKSFRTIKELAK